MAIDIERMLRSTIVDVFGNDATVEYASSGQVFTARLTQIGGEPIDVGLRSSFEWSDAYIFDLDPGVDASATLFDYDDEAAAKTANLRALALVLRAFARGEGRVERKTSWIRRRTRPFYKVNIDGNEWTLGHNVSVSHYPVSKH